MKLRFRLNDLKLFYQIINNMVPIMLPSYIVPTLHTQARHTRRTAGIIDGCDTSTYYCNIVPNCDAFKNNYFYRTMKAWNSLPVEIRQADGIGSFKFKLRRYLWSSDIDWPD